MGLVSLADYHAVIQEASLRETESFSASKTSAKRSLGKALDTLSLCRQEIPVDPNLAL